MAVARIPSVEGGIQPTLLDAKGDLITATANDTPARLGVGANNSMLTADSTASTGLKYSMPASLATNARTASYTLVAADAGTRVTMNSASATTVTVNSGLFAANDVVQITNLGVGVLTITAGTATVSTAGVLILAQNASGSLYFTSTGVSIWNGSAAAGGGMTLLSTTAITAATGFTISSIDQTYTDLVILVQNAQLPTAGDALYLRVNGVVLNYGWNAEGGSSGAAVNIAITGATLLTNSIAARILIPRYSASEGTKMFSFNSAYVENTTSNKRGYSGAGYQSATTAITSVNISTGVGGSNFSAQGNIYIYGVK